MTRRDLLKMALASPVLLKLLQGEPCRAQDATQNIDAAVEALIQKHQLPGVGLAISKQGQIVYSAGYGLADKEEGTPFTPQTLCRIGSISKAITGAAVCVLIEQGKFSEDDVALHLVSPKLLEEAVKVDPRYADLRIAHLLTMTSGFAVYKDAMVAGVDAARDLGLPFPVRGLDYLRWMLRTPLDNNPGEKYRYNGTDQILLGRVIEAVTGKSYLDNINALLMHPMGINSFHMAGSRRNEKLKGECTYYTGFKGQSIWPGEQGREEDYCYTLDVTNAEGAGALVCNVEDLARFADAWGNGYILNGEQLAYYFKKRPPSSSGLAGWSVGYGRNNEVEVFNFIGAVLYGACSFAEWKNGYGIALVTNHNPKPGVSFWDVENVVSREIERSTN